MTGENKLWGGRFSGSQDPLAARLNNSIDTDWRLAEFDIRGSIAWANALCTAGAISRDEHIAITQGLQHIREEVNSSTFTLMPNDEDVHTAIERRLVELIGATGGKLHTGRSRNDQVMTDFLLWLMTALDDVTHHLIGLQTVLIERAEKDLPIIMPGYTHFQRAQPVLLSHWWLSHFWGLDRDRQRLHELRFRAAVLPLGSGALAGTPYPINRTMLAQELGFSSISPNSIDAVANRDAATEFLFQAALIGVHLSRLAEALILFSTAEFGFFELADAYATGSSLMPQKKNPDILELTRAKAATAIGRVCGFLSVLKGLPSAYDKDLQEDKQAVFEAYDMLTLTLQVMAGVVATIQPIPQAMQKALDPNLLATDLADYLVSKGAPFRHAHTVVGQVVQHALALGVPLPALPLEQYRQVSSLFEADLYSVFDPVQSSNRRIVSGGTASEAVLAQLQQAKQSLELK